MSLLGRRTKGYPILPLPTQAGTLGPEAFRGIAHPFPPGGLHFIWVGPILPAVPLGAFGSSTALAGFVSGGFSLLERSPVKPKMKKWPGGISDGLTLPCCRCGAKVMFDYTVNDEAWRRVVPAGDRLSVVCLPCFDDLAALAGVRISDVIERVQFTGRSETLVLHLAEKYDIRGERVCTHRGGQLGTFEVAPGSQLQPGNPSTCCSGARSPHQIFQSIPTPPSDRRGVSCARS